MSSTILPFINPPCQTNDLTNSISASYNVSNSFTVSQNFNGIVNSGSESCASLTVSGLATVGSLAINGSGTDAGSFSCGALTSTTAVHSGLVSCNSGLSVVGSLTLPLASVSDASLSSNVSLNNAVQTFSAIKTFSSPPVMSGASITSASIGDASLSSNVALKNVNNNFSVGQTFSAGITDSSTLTVSGIATFNGGLLMPTTQTSLSISVGVLAVNCNSLSNGNFILSASSFNADINSITFSNVVVNGVYDIYIQGGTPPRKVKKAISSGTVSSVNTLSGDTTFASNSYWIARCKCLTSTLMAIEFINYT